MEEDASAEFSSFIADKIRERVKSAVAEKLIRKTRLRIAASADGDELLRGVQPRQRGAR